MAFHRKFPYPGSIPFIHYIGKTYGSRLFCLHNHHITTEHITRILSCKIQNAPILAYIKFSPYSISFHQWSIFSGTNDVVHSPTHYAHCARVRFIPGQVPALSQHHPVVQYEFRHFHHSHHMSFFHTNSHPGVFLRFSERERGEFYILDRLGRGRAHYLRCIHIKLSQNRTSTTPHF